VPEQLLEYEPGKPFSGVIGRTIDESVQAWPAPRRAGEGSPNVIFIVLDDTGFGQLGCFGSPIRTPNLDRLAASGLRYTNMHTAALGSPTRSCVLTGRNHHSNAMSCLTEGSLGFPGANGHIPFENGFLSEILLRRGYSTFAVGKWHLTPAEQISAAGPFDRWPTGRGFERYYGFLGGDTSQYFPELVHDHHQVEPPGTPDEGYHLTTDLVNHCIGYIADVKQVAPTKPFFLYLAPGATHAPHHVPRQWADRYVGEFDDGWDAYRDKVHKRQLADGIIPAGTRLSRHDPDVPRWDTRSADEQRLYARFMEVFAGFLEHTDNEIGRLLEFLQGIGELDNTLLMVLSDNGASPEGGPFGSTNENKFFNNVPEDLAENLRRIDEIGGPTMYHHYPWGWAWAGDTPLRRWKRETYQGGTTGPFIVHWPTGFTARGDIREQYAHCIDIAPTVLDALDIEPPTFINGHPQSPIQGVSFRHTFDDPAAPSNRRTQYFEMLGHRSIYHNGWRAVCPVPAPSFAQAGIPFGVMSLSPEQLRKLDDRGWELYHVASDFTETFNLAAANRERLLELIAMWYVEAGKYQVLPLDTRGAQRLAEPRPQLTTPRSRYTYFPGTSSVPEFVAARVLNKPHSITASVDVPAGGAEGVLLAHGGSSGGYVLFVQDGRLRYVHNYVGSRELHVESSTEVPAGTHQLRFEFEPTGRPDLRGGTGTPGRAQLYIDGVLVGQAELPVTLPIVISIGEGLSCGRDAGSAVSTRYRAPFPFTGALKGVAVDVSGEDLIAGNEADLQALIEGHLSSVLAHQ
jgi:arylsulfatase A-like enzyme